MGQVEGEDLNFSGKVALITGGSKGIGLEIAHSLLAQGARVAITGRNKDQLATAAKKLGNVLTIVSDAGDLSSVPTTVGEVANRLGPIDILINNAALSDRIGGLASLSADRAEAMLRVNTLAPLVHAQQALHFGMAERHGAIVNIASISAFRGVGAMPMYAVTKAALVRLTEVMARDFAPRVRVNAVAPGLVETELATDLISVASEDPSFGYPMKRLGKPIDVVNAVEFLLSDKAAWMTGETLILDGGRLQGSPAPA